LPVARDTIAAMRACIIGAGSSGLVSAKVLAERGIEFDCFEMGTDIGGNWRYGNDNGRSAAYDSLHIDTSKQRMAFSDFPMPEHFPVYPHHSQVLEYFEAYAARFGLKSRITFQTEVVSVESTGDDRWTVHTRNLDSHAEQKRMYDAVLVANGHHWNPRRPEFPGTFTGEALHSHQYRTPELLAGKRVVILGIGNSGTDIAVEAADVASAVYLASRRGAHVIPRMLLGRPADQFTNPSTAGLPLWLSRSVYQLLLWLARGPQRLSGVPVPPNKLLSEHPTLSQDLLRVTRQGRIVCKPTISRLEGNRVEFVDGSTVEADVVIYATGYEITFPFLDRSVIDPVDNRVALYKQVVDPSRPSLYFIGLIQPLGAIMPLAELQAHWVARLIEGAGLPPTAAMESDIAATTDSRAERYVDSPRHTIQVDFYPYMQLMKDEISAAEATLSASAA